MTKILRALVHGSGFAGQGHAQAFRDAGVEIAGMVGRTASVVQDLAGQMEIPYASTDWNRALAELRPDLAIIGTPGGAHVAPILAAIESGCHVFCDKPLAVTADQAALLYRKAREKGIKTAYAASYRYQPQALLARDLVKAGAIGKPQEAECVSHYHLNPLIPWGWSHRIDLGGGRLNNNFTHKLSIVEQVLAGRMLRVSGETRCDLKTAPVVEGVHDFRTRETFAPDQQTARSNPERWVWRDADADWTYTVMGQMQCTAVAGCTQPVSLLFKHSGLQPRFHQDYIAFFGSEGAIHLDGAYAQGPVYLQTRDNGTWQEVPIPAAISRELPDLAVDTQRNWTYLARLFVQDILGQGGSSYQTFREGWIYQEIIDAVRRSDGWFDVPENLA